MIISVITLFLGVKYIWSGADGKSSVKDTLPTFLIGVIFFYLASNLVTFFTDSAKTIFDSASTYATVQGKIMGTVNNIVQIAAFAGFIFVGVKYMLTSADGKADMKQSMIPMLMGIILVFAASSFLDWILAITQQVIV